MKKQSQNKHLSQFSDKSGEKVVHDKIYMLKFEFYNTDRKMKSTIKCIFISIIVHPNFMNFRQNISFKSAIEIFTAISGYLRTALKTKNLVFLSVKMLNPNSVLQEYL